jgi:hypothetical protein
VDGDDDRERRNSAMFRLKRTIGRLVAVAAVALLLAGLGAEITVARESTDGNTATQVVTQTGGH